MKTRLLLAALTLILGSTARAGDDRIVVGGLDGLSLTDSSEAYPVLLALSGGGARGLAAIGILRAFEEKHITPAAIAGTSIGGIVGGLYAAGYSARELSALTHSINFAEVLSNTPSRKSMFLTQREEMGRHFLSLRFDGLKPVIPRALTAGQKLTSILTGLTTKAGYHCRGDFSRLAIPFKTICTDIVSGDEVVLDGGSLAEAMRGTMAFPLAFTPLDRDGMLLMDGGMVIPIPVDLVRTMTDTVDYVVAINTASPLKNKDGLGTAIDIADQATSIMTADKLATQLARADYVIELPADRYKSTDFRLSDELIEEGYRHGLRAADEILVQLQNRRDRVRYDVLGISCRDCDSDLRRLLDQRLAGRRLSRAQVVSFLKEVAVLAGLFRIEARPHAIHLPRDNISTVLIEISFDPVVPMSEVDFDIDGNSVFSEDELAATLRATGPMLTAAALQAALDSVIERYRRRGFDLAHVTCVDVNLAMKRLRLLVDEAIVTGVHVERKGRTKHWFVRSLFPLRRGEPYSSAKAAEGLRNIYATDLFQRVTLDLARRNDGPQVIIGLQEKEHTQLRLGWHWDDDYRSEEFVEVLDANLGGIGLEGVLHAQYGPDRQLHYAGMRADRIWSTYLTARVRAYLHRLDRPLYGSDGTRKYVRRECKSGIEGRLGQQIARFGTVTAQVAFEQVRYEDEQSGTKETFGLRTLMLQSLVETFDRVPFPRAGKKHLFQLELAGKFLGGEVEFTRFFTSLEAYFPVREWLNYHPRFHLGLSRSGLPPSEKFYVGGARSFAGYRRSQLTGEKLVLLGHELRLKLPMRLYLSLRHDMGNVFGTTDQIKIGRLHHGMAAFLALDTPVGPIETGYAFTDTDLDHLYLNIGFDF